MSAPTATAITGSKAGITVAVMLAAVIAVLDISIVNVALSDIRASFGTPLDQIGWVSTGYMMANVVVIPMTGWLQRRFGYRRYFTASILIFTAASILCGLAWSLPSLVAFRVLQGIGGGAIIPTAQSILFARYPKEEHYTALNTGLIFLVAGSIQIVLMPLIGKFAPRFDGRFLLACGILVVSISLWMNGHLTSEASFMDLAGPQLVRAAGMGFIFIPLSVIALSDLPAVQRGNATGLFNLTRELGGSIGTAWMGMNLADSTKVFASQIGESVNIYNPVAQEQLMLIQRGVTSRLADPTASAATILGLRVQVQALIKAFNEGFLLVSALFMLALALVLLLKRPQPGLKIEGAH